MRWRDNWDLFRHGQSHTRVNKRIGFLRVIRQQSHVAESQILQNLQSHHVVPHIGLEPQAMIGFHCIQAFILQTIGAKLGQQANSASFLRQIHHSARAFRLDHGHRHS